MLPKHLHMIRPLLCTAFNDCFRGKKSGFMSYFSTYTVKYNCKVFETNSVPKVFEENKPNIQRRSEFQFWVGSGTISRPEYIGLWSAPNKLLCLLENPLMQFHNSYVQCLRHKSNVHIYNCFKMYIRHTLGFFKVF